MRNTKEGFRLYVKICFNNNEYPNRIEPIILVIYYNLFVFQSSINFLVIILLVNIDVSNILLNRKEYISLRKAEPIFDSTPSSKAVFKLVKIEIDSNKSNEFLAYVEHADILNPCYELNKYNFILFFKHHSITHTSSISFALEKLLSRSLNFTCRTNGKEDICRDIKKESFKTSLIYLCDPLYKIVAPRQDYSIIDICTSNIDYADYGHKSACGYIHPALHLNGASWLSKQIIWITNILWAKSLRNFAAMLLLDHIMNLNYQEEL